MNLPVIIIIGFLVVIVVIVMVYSAYSFQSKRRKISEADKQKASLKRFAFYWDFPLTRTTFRKIHGQVSSLAVYNMNEQRVVAVQFFERSLISATILFILGFIGMGDLISGIVLFMFAIVMLNTTVNKRIDDVNFQTLKDISEYIQKVREAYTRVRNIPDAVHDAKCSKLLRRNVEELYLICTANDAELRLDRFYMECPSRTLKTLATTCYVRADSGEEVAPGGVSPFKQALSLIKDETDQEIRRQINQRLMFGTIDKLPFVPLFLYPPIVIFYKNMISATAAVFDSSIGYCIKLAVVLTCFVCYYILSTINNSSVAATDDRNITLSIILRKYDWAKKLAERLTPLYEVTDKKYQKIRILKKQIRQCLSKKDLNYFYFEKNVYAFLLLPISFVFSIIILISARNATYNSITSSTMSATLTYTKEQEVATREYDHAVLAMPELPSVDDMTDAFENIFPKYSSVEIEAQVTRLTQKYSTYHKLKFHWWFAFIYIGCWILGYNIPNLLLKLRLKMVTAEVELDIMQLQTVIAVLMDTNADTLEVIYWLAKSSDIHKGVLTKCYHSYVKDPEDALYRLKLSTTSAEFSSMIEKLETTISQVTLAEAFEDLISERHNSMQIREAVQMEQLKSKRNLAGPVALAPAVVWMVAVFILPIGIVAVRSAVSLLGQLQF